MIKIGAVWQKEKDGRPYLSGVVDVDAELILREGLRIVLFHPRTERENGPTWEVMIAKPRPKDEGTRGDDGLPF